MSRAMTITGITILSLGLIFLLGIAIFLIFNLRTPTDLTSTCTQQSINNHCSDEELEKYCAHAPLNGHCKNYCNKQRKNNFIDGCTSFCARPSYNMDYYKACQKAPGINLAFLNKARLAKPLK